MPGLWAVVKVWNQRWHCAMIPWIFQPISCSLLDAPRILSFPHAIACFQLSWPAAPNEASRPIRPPIIAVACFTPTVLHSHYVISDFQSTAVLLLLSANATHFPSFSIFLLLSTIQKTTIKSDRWLCEEQTQLQWTFIANFYYFSSIFLIFRLEKTLLLPPLPSSLLLPWPLAPIFDFQCWVLPFLFRSFAIAPSTHIPFEYISLLPLLNALSVPTAQWWCVCEQISTFTSISVSQL